MKKLLLIVLITLLLSLVIYILLQGFAIGEIEVLSYNDIVERSEQLDGKIQEASKLAEKDFKSMISNVEENTKKLMDKKKEYEDTVLINTENGTQIASQIEEYKVETLWVKMGTHATAEGAVLQMDITNSATGGKDRYDLNFTVNGSYIAITDFISDIENDSTLGFKIEEFKINRDTSDTDLVARFSCKNVAIENIGAVSNNASTQTTNNTTNTNTTNTTTTNTTTNTSSSATNKTTNSNVAQ